MWTLHPNSAKEWGLHEQLRGFRGSYVWRCQLFSVSGCAGKQDKFSPWLCPPSFQSPDTLTLISLFSWTPGSFCLPRDHLDFAFFPLFPQQARHWVITETDCKPQHALEGRKCECGEEGHPHHDPALQGSPAGKTSLPTWGIWQVSFIDSSVRVQNRVTSHYL